MVEGTGPGVTRRSHRRSVGGAGLFIVLALGIGISADLWLTSSSCACAEPADLIVLDYAHRDATVTWQGPGPLGLPIGGLSGEATVRACTTLSQSLRPGEVRLSLRVGSAIRTLSVTVPAGDARLQHPAVFVIDAAGRLVGPTDQAPPGGFPQDPLCR